jgi:hypothetical protein
VVPFSVEDAKRLAQQVGGGLDVEAGLGVIRIILRPT